MNKQHYAKAVKTFTLLICGMVLITSCKLVDKAASVRPLKIAGAVGKGAVFVLENANPVAMVQKMLEADPKHPKQDQMLIDLHNQLLTVRSDMNAIGKELGITIELPPLVPTIAETRQLVEQTTAITVVNAVEVEPPPPPEEVGQNNDLPEANLANIDRERLKETGFAYLKTSPDKLFTGRAKEHHPNGKKKMQVTYWEGRSHGPLVRWHANGKKNFEVLMSNNMAEGEATEWYPSGKKFRTTPFKGGIPHGTVTVWDENGKILSEQQYENGNLLKKEEK
jgi:hypothetical protein